MNNYYTYLDYYGNSTFSKIRLNEVDMLIFASLVYLPLIKIREGITIKQFGEKLNVFKPEDFKGMMTPEALKLMSKVYKCKRYENIKIYKMEKTDDDRLQFGAFTLRFGNITCVIYEGTNTSIPGWIENFNLATTFPTLTQTYGINYLKRTIKASDKYIYLGGHSKGGNLCLSSAYLAPDNIFDRIKKIYNFDGPGFRDEEFNNKRFEIVNKKTINYLPDESVVGIFLNNKNYRYVDADGISFQKHNPFKWRIFGEFFVKDQLHASSANLKVRVEKGIGTASPEELKNALVVADKFFKDNKIYHTYDFNKLKVKDLNVLIKKYKNLDPKSKELVINVVKYIINANKHVK